MFHNIFSHYIVNLYIYIYIYIYIQASLSTHQSPFGAAFNQWMEKDIRPTLIYININLFILTKVICIVSMVKLNYHLISTTEISPMSEFLEILMQRTVSLHM